ncbi:unnamed protein product [Danaus chrysippus]|uniref:(African queen) hypothetical protein n=1 Tax=Danaus chrysippus TaxID=151541 RepID=A0A8J2QS39_9NEOP|nr:unnamed protein product [Danaus chrysippus]
MLRSGAFSIILLRLRHVLRHLYEGYAPYEVQYERRSTQTATVKRLCYWCGPLAEQVNRSPRAPPCDASTEPIITGCEPEFPYCAVVATSPPYVESRLCVKLYQDECYPLFCNSTRTWKMTCPCRDDLCNGANTERENEAFTILDKLVAKTKTSRVKRTGITAVQFIPSGSDKN